MSRFNDLREQMQTMSDALGSGYVEIASGLAEFGSAYRHALEIVRSLEAERDRLLVENAALRLQAAEGHLAKTRVQELQAELARQARMLGDLREEHALLREMLSSVPH